MKDNQFIKILYTIPNFDTAGSGKALLNIAIQLDKTKFEPHICCSHNNGDFFEKVKSSGIPVHIFQTTTLMKPRIKGLLNCIKIAIYLKQLDVDLIHSFHYAPDYSEALAAKIAGIPWIYTKKNMNWGGLSKNGWKLRTFLAKHIIAQNNTMLKQFFPKSKKTSKIPRGVNVKEFNYQPPNKDIRMKIGIAKKEKVIITVANLSPVKGIELLLESFEELFKKNENIHLIIVGDTNNEYAQELKNNIINYKSKNKIHFSGKVNNVKEYYSISHVFVLPSKKESCPVALLEAIAFGLPIIASDIPGNREILNNFNNNLFPLNSKINLIKKLSDILFNVMMPLEDNNLLKSTIRIFFNIELEVKRHEQLYLSILN